MGEEQTTYRIADLPDNDRPRERLIESGASVLSDAELLAILLRTGLPGENAVQLGQRLLITFDRLPGLARVPFAVLSKQRGVGPAKAAQIMAAIELGRRINVTEAKNRLSITSPKDVAELVKDEMSALDHEELWVLLFDTRNRHLKTVHLYKGTLNQSMVRVGEVFKHAIQWNAANIIIVHNHPSGDPTPSAEDVNLTRTIVKTGKMMDIEVLDHLIIAGGRFTSLKEKKLGFE